MESHVIRLQTSNRGIEPSSSDVIGATPEFMVNFKPAIVGSNGILECKFLSTPESTVPIPIRKAANELLWAAYLQCNVVVFNGDPQHAMQVWWQECKVN
jgi:hypothetical protein